MPDKEIKTIPDLILYHASGQKRKSVGSILEHAAADGKDNLCRV
ncbi:MAG: hypothetical protein WC532_09055 [Candidatus Omnitrophota bacterium]